MICLEIQKEIESMDIELLAIKTLCHLNPKENYRNELDDPH